MLYNSLSLWYKLRILTFIYSPLSAPTSYNFQFQEILREMRSRDSTWVAESDAAASEATKGALSGAAKVLISVSSLQFHCIILCWKRDEVQSRFVWGWWLILWWFVLLIQWGIIAGLLGAAGYALSPIYRGLTIQFKLWDSRLHSCLCSFLVFLFGTGLSHFPWFPWDLC